jgi:hypothetical protein
MDKIIYIDIFARLYGKIVDNPEIPSGSELLVLKIIIILNDGETVINGWLKKPFSLSNYYNKSINLKKYYPYFELLDGTKYAVRVGSPFYLISH